MNKLYLIGIGYRPFDERTREIIINSDIVLASSNRLFEIFKGYYEFETVKDKIKVINNVNETIEFIKSEIQNPKSKIQTIVLLTSGDPMFHGIGRRAVKEFGKDKIEILPDLSSIQVAFSRIKETWDDALLISLHGKCEKRYKMDDLPMLLQQHNKIAILTNKENNPAKIAKTINSKLKTPSFYWRKPENSKLTMYICERLGYLDERIIKGNPEDILVMDFLEPNVVIIQSTPNSKQNTGKLYCLGVGPGDPELLTLKAVRILKEVPCIYVPKGKEESISLALSIVEKVVNLEDKEIIEAYFPMRKNESDCELKWQETVDKILVRLNQGIDVAFITIGDPTIYSTFFYLYDKLPQLIIEIIPGVSSITASASKAKIPLGLGDEKIAILPATYMNDIKETLNQFDTVVLMKVHRVFDQIKKTLFDLGIIKNARYISKIGIDNERIFEDIREVKEEDLK